MMFPIGNLKKDLHKLNESVSLQNQVKVVRLQDKLGKQNFHEDMEEVFEPLADTLKKTSEIITKTITETSTKIIRAKSDLNEKVSELMDEKVLIAPYLASSLVNLFISENKSQFRLRKDLIQLE